MEKNAQLLLCGFMSVLSLVACGDESGSSGVLGNSPEQDEIYSTLDDLPNCTPNREGDSAIIVDIEKYLYCFDGKWQSFTEDYSSSSLVPNSSSLAVFSLSSSSFTTDIPFSSSSILNDPIASISSSSVKVTYIEVPDKDKLPVCDLENVNLRTLILADSSFFTCKRNGWSKDTVYLGYAIVPTKEDLSTCNAGNIKQRVLVKQDSVFFDCDSIKWEPETANGYVVNNISVVGNAHKGPFKLNSSLTLREVLLRNDSLVYTGRIYIDKISSNAGDYVIPKVNLVYPYAVLEVRGLWRNEITGVWSKDSMTLRALTELPNKVNVNLLTHLEYDRAVNLVNKGYSVSAAKMQANYEIMAAFEITSTTSNSETTEMFGSNADPTLLAIAVLFVGNRSDAEITQVINSFRADIANDGVWDDRKTKAEMADWAESFDYGTIRTNAKNWNIVVVPEFETQLTSFWNNAYGLGGCEQSRYNEVSPVANSLSVNYGVHYICKTTGWQKATDYEKDTYQWTDGLNGEIKKGNVTDTYYTFNGTNWAVAARENAIGLCVKDREGIVEKYGGMYYICKSNVWEIATTLEYDTYQFGKGEDGEVRQGKVNADKFYVYEDGTWRSSANEIENILGACVTGREGVVGKVENAHYICRSKNWEAATILEYDTYGYECLKDGSIINGKENIKKNYVCDADSFREANKTEINLDKGCVSYTEGTEIRKKITASFDSVFTCVRGLWNGKKEIVYDTLYDSRIGRSYKTVVIGTQTWMAENLEWYIYNWSWCYGDKLSCSGSGRLYTWAYAMDSVGTFSTNGKGCGFKKTCTPKYPVRGICPEGWHLPTKTEFEILFSAVGGRTKAGMALKKATGWNSNGSQSGNGTDDYGFSAFASGQRNPDGSYSGGGNSASFWTSTPWTSSTLDYGAYFMHLSYLYDFGDFGYEYKEPYAGSIRCLKDSPESSSSVQSSSSSIINGLLDSRDGKVYKTVTIGNTFYEKTTWMAENLNYEVVNSFCYNDSASYCDKYGRLYTWSAAMDSAGIWSNNGVGCGSGIMCSSTFIVQGICPAGWHLPTQTEWTALISAVNENNAAAKWLKSDVGWDGVDRYGFSALPAGWSIYGKYYGAGSSTQYWSSTENSSSAAFYVSLSSNHSLEYENKKSALSIRCVMN